MYAIATFLVVAAITMVFTQMAAGALIATGMPPPVAAFQARSAFSGAGFTTTEAENVVNHPVRRRIIMAAMFVGTLGTPTLVVTVLVGFVAPGPGSTTERTLVAVSGVVLILLVIVNRPVTRVLEGVGRRYAQARLLPAVAGAGHELLALDDEFVVASAGIGDETEESPRSLRGLDHTFPALTVLGVQRDGQLIAEGPADLSLQPGDRLVVFGPRSRLRDLGLLGEGGAE
jgi:hypothetical protein